MKQDQDQKSHICRFCKQSFLNGRQLGGHMRRHLALISACKKQKDQENINGEMGLDVQDDDQMIKKTEDRKQSIQENNNGEVGLDFDDVMVKKSQRIVGVDQDYNRGNVYVLRENPKKSWRVSNNKESYSKDYGDFCQKICDSRKELVKQSLCEKCGKSFNSMKALYGHMRCHSFKRSRPLDQDDDEDDEEVANPVRKKRSCTRYKSPKPNHHCDSFSSYDEVEYGAICLMMLSRGVRDLHEVKMVISDQASNVEFEVSVDGLMKNKSKLDLKKDFTFESGSAQMDPGRVGSAKPMSCDQDFGDVNVADFDISFELLERDIFVQFV